MGFRLYENGNFPVYPLSKGCGFISGFAFKSSDFIDSGIPVIKIKNIQNGMVTTQGSECISPELLSKRLDKFILSNNDVLIAMTGQGSVGRVGRLKIHPNESPLLNQRVGKFVTDEISLNLDYLYYVISSKPYEEYLFAAGSGSGQPNLSPSTILSTEIPFPEYNTQVQIGTVLKSLDDKINLNRQINQTLEAMAQALFKSWFVDFEPVRAKKAALETGEDPTLAAMRIISGKTDAGLAALQTTDTDAYNQLYTTASLFPDAFAESELGLMPEGWKIVTIGETFKVTMGQSPSGETYNDSAQGLPFYQGRTDFGFRFPKRRIYCSAPTRIAEEGETLLSVRAPVGDLNITIERCCIGRGVAALIHNSGSTSFSYYLLSVLEPKFDGFNAEGTVFGSINQKDLKGIKYIDTEKKLISSFEVAIIPFDQKIKTLSEQVQTLVGLRDTLLPKLLSGEVRLDDLNK